MKNQTVKTYLDQLEEITLSDLPACERKRQILELSEMETACLRIYNNYGTITVDGKTVRVVEKEGELYYSIRDALRHAGVSMGYQNPKRQYIKDISIDGPGRVNPAKYVKMEGIQLFAQSAKYERSRDFLGKLLSAIKLPAPFYIKLLCYMQNNDVNERKEAFDAWLKVVYQSGTIA